MMKPLEAGQEVQYLYEGEWRDGVIHGVRTYENEDGQISRLTYLIDTGNDLHSSEITFDHRDIEFNKRVTNLVAKGKDRTEAIEEVMKHDNLPPSKIETTVVRQPEQIELDQELVKPKN